MSRRPLKDANVHIPRKRLRLDTSDTRDFGKQLDALFLDPNLAESCNSISLTCDKTQDDESQSYDRQGAIAGDIHTNISDRSSRHDYPNGEAHEELAAVGEAQGFLQRAKRALTGFTIKPAQTPESQTQAPQSNSALRMSPAVPTDRHVFQAVNPTNPPASHTHQASDTHGNLQMVNPRFSTIPSPNSRQIRDLLFQMSQGFHTIGHRSYLNSIALKTNNNLNFDRVNRRLTEAEVRYREQNIQHCLQLKAVVDQVAALSDALAHSNAANDSRFEVIQNNLRNITGIIEIHPEKLVQSTIESFEAVMREPFQELERRLVKNDTQNLKDCLGKMNEMLVGSGNAISNSFVQLEERLKNIEKISTSKSDISLVQLKKHLKEVEKDIAGEGDTNLEQLRQRLSQAPQNADFQTLRSLLESTYREVVESKTGVEQRSTTIAENIVVHFQTMQQDTVELIMHKVGEQLKVMENNIVKSIYQENQLNRLEGMVQAHSAEIGADDEKIRQFDEEFSTARMQPTEPQDRS